MKTISLQETPTHYLIKIEREAIQQGPMMVHQQGKPIAVLLSNDEYEAFQAWQVDREKPQFTVLSDFEAEVATFERLKPTLLKQYPGQVVAIYKEQVVEVGNNKMAVLEQVQKKFGDIPCYIEWIEAITPHRVRIPSARVVSA